MTGDPLEHVIAFWKPMMEVPAVGAPGNVLEPAQTPGHGFGAMAPASEPRRYTIVDGPDRIRIFAAVEPIGAVPPSATVVAEVLDDTGTPYSYVLRHSDNGAVVVPFDPTRAIEAFWHEDYLPRSRRSALPKPLLSFYYTVAKRFMPAVVRQWLRRRLAHRALASPDMLTWPMDQDLDLLQRFLLKALMLAAGRTEVEFVWFWPDRHPWAVTLTHDVETGNGLARVPHVAELERKRGLRSSFNMVPRDYEVPDALVQDLTGDGFEIGVHGYTHDGLLFSSRTVFDERTGTIEAAARRWGAVGFRSPATYRNPDWLPLLPFEYDSSYSNTAPCEPQPGGCGSFFPFAVGRMTELPITLPQDHTLFELLQESGPGTWLSVLSAIKASHGMACVLAHPDPAEGYMGMPENQLAYEAVLDEVAASDAWKALPRDVARWWRARAEASPEAGALMERASLGTACLDAAGRLEIVPPPA